MIDKQVKICIVGCGNMGLIYAQLLLKSGKINPKSLVLIAKDEIQQIKLKKDYFVTIELVSTSIVESADVLLLAIKPQDFNNLGKELEGRIKSDALVISIMAGINVKTLQKSLNHEFIIRAMPNAPALYGKGITVYYSSNAFSTREMEFGEFVLNLTGKTIKTDKEELLDSVTAISGSGPAYFFYLTLQMKNAAINLGMDAEMAEILVRETLIGSAEMAANNSIMMSELINTIASKGGTTEAALNYFNFVELDQIILSALEKATLRSKELAQKKD
ncbi:MAG: pyrroline-5-carboxylate reductase [Bacteroidota bacterium]